MSREWKKKNISIRSSQRLIPVNAAIEMIFVQALVDISGVSINAGNSGILILPQRRYYNIWFEKSRKGTLRHLRNGLPRFARVIMWVGLNIKFIFCIFTWSNHCYSLARACIWLWHAYLVSQRLREVVSARESYDYKKKPV